MSYLYGENSIRVALVWRGLCYLSIEHADEIGIRAWHVGPFRVTHTRRIKLTPEGAVALAKLEMLRMQLQIGHEPMKRLPAPNTHIAARNGVTI